MNGKNGIDIETSMDKLIEIDKLMLESINKKIGLLNKLHEWYIFIFSCNIWSVKYILIQNKNGKNTTG